MMLRKPGMRTLMPFLTSWGDPDASRTSCAVVTGGKTDTASSKTVGIPLCPAPDRAVRKPQNCKLAFQKMTTRLAEHVCMQLLHQT
jgi:hypothetical protein